MLIITKKELDSNGNQTRYSAQIETEDNIEKTIAYIICEYHRIVYDGEDNDYADAKVRELLRDGSIELSGKHDELCVIRLYRFSDKSEFDISEIRKRERSGLENLFYMSAKEYFERLIVIQKALKNVGVNIYIDSIFSSHKEIIELDDVVEESVCPRCACLNAEYSGMIPPLPERDKAEIVTMQHVNCDDYDE